MLFVLLLHRIISLLTLRRSSQSHPSEQTELKLHQKPDADACRYKIQFHTSIFLYRPAPPELELRFPCSFRVQRKVMVTKNPTPKF